MIVVALFHCDNDGHPVPPQELDLDVWNRTLAGIGDPWLQVIPLIEQAKVSQADGAGEGTG